MDRPAFLENKIINALQVNPLNVNLRILCPQFYTFAIKYLELYPFRKKKFFEEFFQMEFYIFILKFLSRFLDEDPDLAEILIKVCLSIFSLTFSLLLFFFLWIL